MAAQLLRSMYYDHPTYVVHQQLSFANKAAGASTAYDKFVLFAASQIYSIGATCVTAATSTATGWNGTATVTSTTADQLSLIRVVTAGTSTTTSTYGPFVLDGGVGSFRQIQLSGTGTGSSTATGGISVNAGDVLYLQRGTDAAAVQLPFVEFATTPTANVSA